MKIAKIACYESIKIIWGPKNISKIFFFKKKLNVIFFHMFLLWKKTRGQNLIIIIFLILSQKILEPRIFSTIFEKKYLQHKIYYYVLITSNISSI